MTSTVINIHLKIYRAPLGSLGEGVGVDDGNDNGGVATKMGARSGCSSRAAHAWLVLATSLPSIHVGVTARSVHRPSSAADTCLNAAKMVLCIAASLTDKTAWVFCAVPPAAVLRSSTKDTLREALSSCNSAFCASS